MATVKKDSQIIILLICSLLSILSSSIVSAEKPISVKLSQSSQQVWQRQQVLITLEVVTDDPFSRLEVDIFSQNGFSVTAFDLQRIESNKHTTLTIKWAVFPFIAGKQALKLPRVRYRPNSGRMQTLALKALPLNVRRLPLYVPPTMPVGKISLKNSWEKGWLVITHNLLEWQVTVKGKGVAKQFMPPLSRQLESTDAIEILPLQKSDKTIKTVTDLTHQRHYIIPLKVRSNGFVNLPKIEIQYFEPISGKLAKTHLSPPFVIALNRWLLGFIFLLFVALLSVFLFMLVTKIKHVFNKQKKQKQAIRQLSQATNYQQIRAALNQYALVKGWGENVALKTLPMLKAQGGVTSVLLEETINKLLAIQFSQKSSGVEIIEIKNDLLQCLR